MKDKRITDLELLEYIAHRLPPTRRGEVESQLAGSEPDRTRLEELQQTWDVMGEWRVDTAGYDVVSRVMDRIREQQRRRMWSPLNWPAIVRVAAMWLIAVAIGYTAGRLAVSKQQSLPEARDTASQTVVEEEVVQVLQLDVLGSDESTGLVELVLEDTEQNDKEAEG